MPQLPLDVSNWLLVFLVGLAVYFLKGLHGNFRETKQTSEFNKQKIALLELEAQHQERRHQEQLKFQAQVNKDLTERMKELGDLIRGLQLEIVSISKNCAANHGRVDHGG